MSFVKAIPIALSFSFFFITMDAMKSDFSLKQREAKELISQLKRLPREIDLEIGCTILTESQKKFLQNNDKIINEQLTNCIHINNTYLIDQTDLRGNRLALDVYSVHDESNCPLRNKTIDNIDTTWKLRGYNENLIYINTDQEIIILNVENDTKRSLTPYMFTTLLAPYCNLDSLSESKNHGLYIGDFRVVNNKLIILLGLVDKFYLFEYDFVNKLRYLREESNLISNEGFFLSQDGLNIYSFGFYNSSIAVVNLAEKQKIFLRLATDGISKGNFYDDPHIQIFCSEFHKKIILVYLPAPMYSMNDGSSFEKIYIFDSETGNYLYSLPDCKRRSSFLFPSPLLIAGNIIVYEKHEPAYEYEIFDFNKGQSMGSFKSKDSLVTCCYNENTQEVRFAGGQTIIRINLILKSTLDRPWLTVAQASIVSAIIQKKEMNKCYELTSFSKRIIEDISQENYPEAAQSLKKTLFRLCI